MRLIPKFLAISDFCQFVFSVERLDLSRLVGYRYWPTAWEVERRKIPAHHGDWLGVKVIALAEGPP